MPTEIERLRDKLLAVSKLARKYLTTDSQLRELEQLLADETKAILDKITQDSQDMGLYETELDLRLAVETQKIADEATEPRSENVS